MDRGISGGQESSPEYTSWFFSAPKAYTQSIQVGEVDGGVNYTEHIPNVYIDSKTMYTSPFGITDTLSNTSGDIAPSGNSVIEFAPRPGETMDLRNVHIEMEKEIVHAQTGRFNIGSHAYLSDDRMYDNGNLPGGELFHQRHPQRMMNYVSLMRTRSFIQNMQKLTVTLNGTVVFDEGGDYLISAITSHMRSLEFFNKEKDNVHYNADYDGWIQTDLEGERTPKALQRIEWYRLPTVIFAGATTLYEQELVRIDINWKSNVTLPHAVYATREESSMIASSSSSTVYGADMLDTINPVPDVDLVRTHYLNDVNADMFTHQPKLNFVQAPVATYIWKKIHLRTEKNVLSKVYGQAILQGVSTVNGVSRNGFLMKNDKIQLEEHIVFPDEINNDGVHKIEKVIHTKKSLMPELILGGELTVQLVTCMNPNLMTNGSAIFHFPVTNRPDGIIGPPVVDGLPYTRSNMHNAVHGRIEHETNVVQGRTRGEVHTTGWGQYFPGATPLIRAAAESNNINTVVGTGDEERLTRYHRGIAVLDSADFLVDRLNVYRKEIDNIQAYNHRDMLRIDQTEHERTSELEVRIQEAKFIQSSPDLLHLRNAQQTNKKVRNDSMFVPSNQIGIDHEFEWQKRCMGAYYKNVQITPGLQYQTQEYHSVDAIVKNEIGLSHKSTYTTTFGSFTVPEKEAVPAGPFAGHSARVHPGTKAHVFKGTGGQTAILFREQNAMSTTRNGLPVNDYRATVNLSAGASTCSGQFHADPGIIKREKVPARNPTSLDGVLIPGTNKLDFISRSPTRIQSVKRLSEMGITWEVTVQKIKFFTEAAQTNYV